MSHTNSHGLALIAYDPAYIVRYVSQNPINWSSSDLAGKDKDGDQAGVTPTPAVEEFLSLLRQWQRLFTQHDYWLFCVSRWDNWLHSKTPIQIEGVKAKCYRNFYPSMIDSLHVWAMLSLSGRFDYCVLDSYKDAIGKTDLTLVRGQQSWKVALQIDSDAAKRARIYKDTYRGQSANCLTVPLSFSRPRAPGNKRWYCIEDFSELFTHP